MYHHLFRDASRASPDASAFRRRKTTTMGYVRRRASRSRTRNACNTRASVRARVSARVDGRRVARTARGARARDADQGLARAVKVGRRGPFATTGAREDALERRWMRVEGGFLIARARARGAIRASRARGWARARRSVACGF